MIAYTIRRLALALALSVVAFGSMVAAPASAQHVRNAGAPRAAGAADAEADARQQQKGVPQWGIASQELEPDPAVIFGLLENGMRYAVRSHVRGSGEISMRLLIDAGSMEEEDDEQGAAHFVEHMAFNGSTNIPEGELVPTLERLGLAFGPDTNAETAMEYTMYKLELPNSRAATVDTSLKILREIASELTFAPTAVEREKGILRSEAQLRNTAPARRSTEFFRSAFQSDRIADRAGASPEQLSTLDADKLRAFYEGYYRPDRATLVVIGDFNPRSMEQKIRTLFSDWSAKGKARAPYDARVAETPGTRIGTFVDAAVPEIVEMQRIVPYRDPGNDIAGFRDQLFDQIVATTLTNRINALAKQENAAVIGGSSGAWDYFQEAKTYGFVLLAKDGGWRPALEIGEQEWRRLHDYGLTESELAEAKSNLESNYASLAKSAPSMNIGEFAEAIALSSLNNSVYLSPAQTLALYRAQADRITLESLAAYIRDKWDRSPSYVMVAGKSPVPDAAATIAAALDESARLAVAAPVDAGELAFAYSDFGEPGKIVSDNYIADLGIRSVKFDNGFMLNLKRTRYEPGHLSYRLEVAGGSGAFAQGYPGLNLMAQIVSPVDGLGAHDFDDLRRLIAGQQLGYGFNVEQDSIVLEGFTTRDSAAFQMRLLAAEVADKAFGRQTQQQWTGYAPIIATDIANAPMDLYFNALDSVLTDGDTRLGFIDPEALRRRSLDDLKAMVGSQFATGPTELALVGDFDEDAMIETAAATLGALKRTVVKPTYAPLRFSKDRSLRTLYHTGPADQGVVSLSWPTDDARDLRKSLTLELLAKLMELRANDMLREELGATYSPYAFGFDTLAFEGYGHLTILASAEPDSMPVLARAMRDIARELADDPPSSDALLRARQPILEGYERQEGTNNGWTFIVSAAQRHPDILERRRTRGDLMRSITPREIQQAAKGYFQEAPIEIRVLPQVAASAGATGE